MSAEFYDIMFNLGDTPLPYESHAEQSLAIQTPNGLPGIPVTSGGNYTDSTGQQWICDEIDLERGKCIKRTHIQEVLGAEKLNSIQIDNTTTRFAFKPDYPGDSSAGMYTHGKYKKVWDVDEEAAYVAPDLAVLRINKGTVGTTEETIKNYLKTAGIKILYALQTPIEVNLTPEEIAAYKALHTYYPTTVVTNNANADMRLDYVADTKLYVKKELEKIVSTQIQKTANLLSLMPLETQAAMIDNDTNNILENMEVQNHE